MPFIRGNLLIKLGDDEKECVVYICPVMLEVELLFTSAGYIQMGSERGVKPLQLSGRWKAGDSEKQDGSRRNNGGIFGKRSK